MLLCWQYLIEGCYVIVLAVPDRRDVMLLCWQYLMEGCYVMVLAVPDGGMLCYDAGST